MFKTIVTLSCNTPNCKTTPVTGEERTPTFFAARKAGWECINAAEQYCPDCRAKRHPKVEKAPKAEKAAVAKATKTAKVEKVTKANTKANTTKAPVAKAQPKPATKTTKANTKPVAPIAGAQAVNLAAIRAKNAKKA